MAQTDSMIFASIPKRVRQAAIPVVFMWVTFVFVIFGFPYGLVVDDLAARIEHEHGVKLHVGEVDLALGLLGPGFRLEDVRTRLPDGASYDVDHLFVRPAVSLSWLSGDPAIFIDIGTPVGNARGTAILGAVKGWDGDLREVDMSRVPFLNDPESGLELSGDLDASVDLVMGADGLVGEVEFSASDGIALHESLPMGVPFEDLQGELVFGGDTRLSIESLDLQSPFMRAQASGTIGAAPLWSQSELDIALEFSGIDANLRPLVSGLGTRVSDEGTASAQVSGTLGAPRIR